LIITGAAADFHQIISMKYLYILLGIIVTVSGNTAAPTTGAKNFSVNAIEGSYLNIGWSFW
jgi:hypothetical protein